jgi:hypothetical protein
MSFLETDKFERKEGTMNTPTPDIQETLNGNPNLRLVDLVAKTAKVSLKDAMRVLLAADILTAATGKTIDEITVDQNFSLRKPTEEEASACEYASFALHQYSRNDARAHALMNTIQHIAGTSTILSPQQANHRV